MDEGGSTRPDPVAASMTNPTNELLKRAAASLDDARLLAEHRRVNEIVLTRLALHQALQAISMSEGLDADDELRLDTLLKRVPDDHPQAARIAALRDEAAQTIAAVAELVQALSAPEPRPVASKRKRPEAELQSGEEREADTEPAVDRRTAEPGPTAFAASPRGNGRTGPADSFPSAAFWTLMDRWHVDDLEALALIGHTGGLTKKGTRPRFRVQGEEAARYVALRRLDTALETLALDPPSWLASTQTDAPFKGDTPLAVLQRDGENGARQLLHALNRQGLAAGLKAALG